jgi:hypothetical protein
MPLYFHANTPAPKEAGYSILQIGENQEKEA